MKPPKPPADFDYDLWTTKDGKRMVRVKSTGETCEVDADTFRLLRAEEKALRRSVAANDTAPLSTDLRPVEVEDAESGWLIDPTNLEDSVTGKLALSLFIAALTPYQRDIFEKCMLDGMTLTDYSKRRGVDVTAIRNAKRLIQKKAKKFLD